MSEQDERAAIVSRLAEIGVQRDEVLLQLATLAVRGGPAWWDRIEALGDGMAARAAMLLSESLDVTIGAAEALTINAATPRTWIAGCGHPARGTQAPEMCGACAA